MNCSIIDLWLVCSLLFQSLCCWRGNARLVAKIKTRTLFEINERVITCRPGITDACHILSIRSCWLPVLNQGIIPVQYGLAKNGTLMVQKSATEQELVYRQYTEHLCIQ